MVKKISAVILALVLCFSVVVLPVSAAGFGSDYTLADGKRIAYKVEFDKDHYSAGDTVTVNVYLNVDSNTQIHTGSMAFGVNSAVFDKTVNDAATVKATATANDIYNSFYNEISGLNWAWQKDAIVTRVSAANTAAENAAYDQYLKVVFTRNLSGTHANANKNTAGLPGDDVNSDKAPFFSFKLKIRDDVADGTPINIAITTGTIGSSPAQTAYKAFLDGSTKNVSPAITAYDVSAAVATATVGTPAPAGPAVTKAKSQVKMTATSATTVADEFSFRVISKISDSDWDTYFKNTGVAGATTDYITAVGMVAYKGAAAFDAETAKKVVAGTPATDYSAAKTDYISKVSDTADAEFGAIIKAKHSTLTNDVTYMGFVQYVDASGNAQTIFYETAGTAALSTNYDTIVNNYLTAYPYAA